LQGDGRPPPLLTAQLTGRVKRQHRWVTHTGQNNGDCSHRSSCGIERHGVDSKRLRIVDGHPVRGLNRARLRATAARPEEAASQEAGADRPCIQHALSPVSPHRYRLLDPVAAFA